MTTRTVLSSSWLAAQRRASIAGAIVLTAPSFAGYALEQAGGSVARARTFVPSLDGSPFWMRVHSCLDAVDLEEQTAPRDEVRP